MIKFRIFLLTVVTLIAGVCCNSDTSVNLQVDDLRCENLINPMGIDTTIPHFSWKLLSEENGTKQKAFKILVATDSLLLEEGKADLWNSGKVKSSNSVMVPYRGKELRARSCAYWKIGVWGEKNSQPVWSNISSFSVGLLEPTDWTGVYIGFPSESGNPVSPLLRKQFKISAPTEKIYLYVNSLGYHEIYLNGEKVGIDVLSPAVSQLAKRSHVVTYDVSSYIKQGDNDLVIWLGRGWYQPRDRGVIYQGPLVKAQMEVLQNNKWETLLASDATWSCRESGYTGTSRNWGPFRFGGDRVEAGNLLDDFSTSTLDAATWIAAQKIDVPEHTVTPAMTEPNRIQGEISPANIISYGKDCWLVDMGTTLTGWVEIHFPKLTKGQEVVMEYSDHFEKGELYNQGQNDRYIASGKNEEVFKNKFHYHGFRYIKISNLSVQPSLDNVHAYLIHTDFKKASSFECSDPDMNAIHDMIQYTMRCLSLGGYIVDCPHIERLGYGGDGNASLLTAQTMFDMSPLFANWIQVWADCVREDGGMPHTAPNPGKGGGGPYWCGFIVPASWNTYVNYGDSRLIEKYYPVMQLWFEYVEKYTVDGLLQRWPDTDYRDWYLGDWLPPRGVDNTAKASVDLVNNCFITECYTTMEKMAKFLGKKDDAAAYAKKKEQLKKLIHERFFDSATNNYATGSQIDLTYAMLAQVTPESLMQEVTKTLYTMTEQEKNGHIAVGLVGVTILTRWAIQNRSADWVYGMLKKKDYPGFLYMIENGAVTTWEYWEGLRSHIHNCYNGMGAWFYQAVGGIRPDEKKPGYRRVIISPQIPDGISWAKTTKETPYGTLLVNWELYGGMLNMNITIPPGCTALLELPGNTKNYTLDGKQYRASKAASNEIPSGKHQVAYLL